MSLVCILILVFPAFLRYRWETDKTFRKLIPVTRYPQQKLENEPPDVPRSRPYRIL